MIKINRHSIQSNISEEYQDYYPQTISYIILLESLLNEQSNPRDHLNSKSLKSFLEITDKTDKSLGFDIGIYDGINTVIFFIYPNRDNPFFDYEVKKNKDLSGLYFTKGSGFVDSHVSSINQLESREKGTQTIQEEPSSSQELDDWNDLMNQVI